MLIPLHISSVQYVLWKNGIEQICFSYYVCFNGAIYQMSASTWALYIGKEIKLN